MMATLLANPARMIERGAPRVIHTDEELEAYTKALFALTSKEHPTRAQADAIELLSLLIDRYERQRFPIPSADPVTVLRFLMEHNGLAQRDIVDDFGGSKSLVSMVISGQRRMSIDHIKSLSARFHVSPSVFMKG